MINTEYMIQVAPPPFGLLRLYMILTRTEFIFVGVGVSKKVLKSGRMVAEPPESYTEGPFIIFNSVRKSNFCTEILIKLRPLAIARTSLICAFLIVISYVCAWVSC